MPKTLFSILLFLVFTLCTCCNSNTRKTEVETEARNVISNWVEGIQNGNSNQILILYSKKGIISSLKGRVDVISYSKLEDIYSYDPPPMDFKLDTLIIDPIDKNTVLASVAFTMKWFRNQGVKGASNMVLIRENGQLRIRSESESLTNLERFAWCADSYDCSIELETSEFSRYVGEYQLGEMDFIVFEENGRLMIQGAFEKPKNRLLYYGNHQFRLDSVPDLRLVFDSSLPKARYFRNFRDIYFGTITRIPDKE